MGFFETIVDTVEDVVGAFGDNIENAADADAVKIEAARTNIALAKQRALAEQARAEKLNNAAVTIAYLLALVFVGYMGVTIYKKL